MLAAEEFLGSWSDQDADAMVEMFEGPVQTTTATQLSRLFERIQRDGAIEEIAVTQTTTAALAVPEGDDTTATIDYQIVYESSAVEEIDPLVGEFDMVFDDEVEEWLVDWDDSLMWPGHEDAAGLQLVTKWPRRGPILDRKGRKLAVGTGESRSYPFGSLAGSVIGHIESVTKKDLKEDPGLAYALGDLRGASGIEEAYEERLAGSPASKLKLVDDDGERVGTLGRQAAIRGRPVKTTLDMKVQRAAQGAYGSTTGGGVVLQPSTGDILAVMDGSPFDPNNYVGVNGIEPFNRALSGLYPPGSSLKVMTAAAALDSGEVTATTKVTGPSEYKGVRNFESGTFGTISFATALQNSVNTAFAQIAEKLGAKKLTRYAEKFGFNRPHDTLLGTADSSFPFPEDLGDLMWGSIGQAQVLATPLQMATLPATVANDGVRMEPRISLLEPKNPTKVMSPEAAATLTELMRAVVIGGTGTAANISGANVAGKTGTAEVSIEGAIQNHAWFVAFAPSDEPLLAVSVVAELGGVGGQVAAPIAGRVIASRPSRSAMRAVIQRVSSARVTVDGRETGSIGRGLLILLGISPGDGESETAWLADKVANLRIFSDDDDKMNLSLLDIEGEALIVSQFTLYGDARKGRRPSFIKAAQGPAAEALYDRTVDQVRALGITCATGEFGAMMDVELTNEGPVTILLDSEKTF